MWTQRHPAHEPIACIVCGTPLSGDPDDDPAYPGGPMCGDCARARADDELMWALDATDGDDTLW